MAVEHADQTRLAEFLAHAEGLLEPMLRHLPAPLALRLDVGLPTEVPLLDHRDLDNYTCPLAKRLSQTSERALDSAWATKKHSDMSSAGLQQAVHRPARDTGKYSRVICTTASTDTPKYKEQIATQMEGIDPLPEGPVELELAFVVGPSRNWLNLWKPTIDALGGLLGRTSPSERWHPRDGRVVELGLHRQVNETIGNDIVIAVEARPA